jgi:hypothetical protein
MTVERLVLLTGAVLVLVALAFTVFLGRAFGPWGIAMILPVAGAFYAAWLLARDQFSYLDHRALEELRDK